jgi:hypothetical protein
MQHIAPCLSVGVPHWPARTFRDSAGGVTPGGRVVSYVPRHNPDDWRSVIPAAQRANVRAVFAAYARIVERQ